MRAEDIAEGRVVVAAEGGRLLGFATLGLVDGEAEILALFVEPAVKHRGIGRALFVAMAAMARAGGAARLDVDADPHALAFYERMGCRQTGLTPSGSIPGRMLPRLALDLDPD